MYDFFLGGAYNFDSDRRLARKVIAQYPDITFAARANRAFVMRAVRYLATVGIDQFIDLGCGLPSAGAVHSQVRAINPAARVVYVDNEPVAVQHGLMMLDGVPGVEIIQADLRYLDTVFDHPVTRELIDLSRPVGVLLAAVLHFVLDADDPAGVVAAIRDTLASGSGLVVSHATADGDASIDKARELYERSQNPGQTRTRVEVAALMTGFRLVSPGVVWVPDWQPDMPYDRDRSPHSHLYGAVGRKP
jgi:hypothetical protein